MMPTNPSIAVPAMPFDVQAWAIEETTYGTTPTTEPLVHLGLIDSMETVMDPQASVNLGLGMQHPHSITPAAMAASYPVSVLAWGAGWRYLMSWAIGTREGAFPGRVPGKHLPSFSILSEQAKSSAVIESVLTNGCVIGSATMRAAWTEGGPLRLDLDIRARDHQPDSGASRATAWDFDDSAYLQAVDLSQVAVPALPAKTSLVLSGDIIVRQCSAWTNGVTVDGGAGSSLSITDTHLTAYRHGVPDPNVGTDGVISLATEDTLTKLAEAIQAADGWTASVHGDAAGADASHLLENLNESPAAAAVLRYARAYDNGQGQGQTTGTQRLLHSIPHLRTAEITFDNQLGATPHTFAAISGTPGEVRRLAHGQVYKQGLEVSMRMTKAAQEGDPWARMLQTRDTVPMIRWEIWDGTAWRFVSMQNVKVTEASTARSAGMEAATTEITVRPTGHTHAFSALLGV